MYRLFSKLSLVLLFAFIGSLSTTNAQKGGDVESFNTFIQQAIKTLKSSPAQFETEYILFPLVTGTGSSTNYTYEKMETISKDDMKRYFTGHLPQLSKKQSYIVSNFPASKEKLFEFLAAYEFSEAAVMNGDVEVTPEPPFQGIINLNDNIFSITCSLPMGTFVSWYCIYLDDTQEYKIWGAIYGE